MRRVSIVRGSHTFKDDQGRRWNIWRDDKRRWEVAAETADGCVVGDDRLAPEGAFRTLRAAREALVAWIRRTAWTR